MMRRACPGRAIWQCMSDAAAPKPLVTLEAAVDALEFDRVDFHNLKGRRTARHIEKNDGDMDMSVMLRARSHGLDVRCRLTCSANHAQLTVDASATFVATEPVVLDEDVAHRFAEQVGVMALYPYLREAAGDLGRRFGQTVSLPLLRRGQVRLSDPTA